MCLSHAVLSSVGKARRDGAGGAGRASAWRAGESERGHHPAGQCFSNLSVHQSRLEGSFKHTWLSPSPGDADPVGLGLALRICDSDRFPGTAL